MKEVSRSITAKVAIAPRKVSPNALTTKNVAVGTTKRRVGRNPEGSRPTPPCPSSGGARSVPDDRVPWLVEIARREGLPKRYVTRLARLAFVSPMVAEAVAPGRAPDGINVQTLIDGPLALPADWMDQQRMLQC
jgi:hypothetical protein